MGMGMGMGMRMGMELGRSVVPPVRQRAIKIKVIDSIWKCLTHDAGYGNGELELEKVSGCVSLCVCVCVCVERSQLPLDGGCLRRGACQQALVIILSHV